MTRSVLLLLPSEMIAISLKRSFSPYASILIDSSNSDLMRPVLMPIKASFNLSIEILIRFSISEKKSPLIKLLHEKTPYI